jgi:succinyl-CoA synthetase beta subunit
MNLHEFQSKQLFNQYEIPVPSGLVAKSPKEAVDAAKSLGGNLWVVKAQIHSGGRGKAGGVKLAETLSEVNQFSKNMLGQRLVTSQSGSDGLPVELVYIEEGSNIDRELYLSLLVDRSSEGLIIMASEAGGMDIEAVAASAPEKILTQHVNLNYATPKEPLGLRLGLDRPSQVEELEDILFKLVELFYKSDASLIEINPLIVTKEGHLMALDAKINIDDNALFRQKSLLKLRDDSQEDDKERAARSHGLNYVSLDGNIACMVNGAGLAMATMDLIKLHGGEPANFLDVGGGATAERVSEAFKIILANSNVEAILVNIFGGIVRCDLIAEGIITAVKEVGVSIPVTVRLEGTNVEKGRKLLKDSGLKIIAAENLTNATKKIISLANGDDQ